jgi:hypothetical protein
MVPVVEMETPECIKVLVAAEVAVAPVCLHVVAAVVECIQVADVVVECHVVAVVVLSQVAVVDLAVVDVLQCFATQELIRLTILLLTPLETMATAVVFTHKEATAFL